MSLDPRLRDGLHRLAEEAQPDVEQHLDETIHRVPPSPVWQGIRVAAYALVVILAVALVPAALSLLGGPGPGTSPEPSASAGCPRPDGGACAGPLAAGAHRSLLFIPPVDYVVPPGWDNPEDLPGTFTLHPPGKDTDAVFLFRDVGVVTQECNWVIDPSVNNTAAAITDWMAANPNLVVTNRQPALVGGLRGVRLDLAASGAYSQVCPNDNRTYPSDLPIVPLFAGQGSGNLAWFIGGSERMRLYVLDLPGGGNLTISIDAINTQLDSLLESATPVMNSLVFDPDYY